MLEAATNVMCVFNMSATMARQGGRVQLEQSDMRLALNIGKMAKEGFSLGAIEETKYLIKKPHAEDREEKKSGVEFPEHKDVKPVIQRHPAMLRQNQMSGCLSCHNGTAKNPQTHWRHKGTGAPPCVRGIERTPAWTPTLPGTPLAPTGNTSGSQPSQIINLAAGYAYFNTVLPCGEFLDDDEDTQHDIDFYPDMLTGKG
jgi:hypothetical protein